MAYLPKIRAAVTGTAETNSGYLNFQSRQEGGFPLNFFHEILDLLFRDHWLVLSRSGRRECQLHGGGERVARDCQNASRGRF